MSAKRRLTLAGVVGVAVAAALGQFIPEVESGRKVEAIVARDGALEIRHVSGRQYLRSYLDIVGVATACDGITSYRGRSITLKDRFSEAQCSEMLEEELVHHAQEMMDCTPGLAISPVPAIEKRREGPRFAATSLTYNIGGPRFCGSTARARFNAADFAGGCTAITWWNRAGGRVSKGLVNRRAREAKVCREGLGAL